MFKEVAPDLFTLEQELRFRFGLTLITRMSVIGRGGALWVHSPLPGTDWYTAIADLGSVRFLVAPNCYHCSYIAAAKERFPDAVFAAPPELKQRRPSLPIGLTLSEGSGQHPAWPTDLISIPVRGAPGIAEHLFYDGRTRSLLVTDILFHNERGANLTTRILLGILAPTGRPVRSREWAWLIKDRGAFVDSLAILDSLQIDRVVSGHGRLIDDIPLALSLMRTGKAPASDPC